MSDLDLDINIENKDEQTEQINAETVFSTNDAVNPLMEEQKSKPAENSNTKTKEQEMFEMVSTKAAQMGIKLPPTVTPDMLSKFMAFMPKTPSLNNNPKNNQQTEQTLPFKNPFQMQQGPLISWRDEAQKGNFMPAIVMLKNKKINADDISNPASEDRLIHQAVTFSFINVTKCLIEKFGCSINIKNKHGHTPLHSIANNTPKDLFLLCYYLNLPNVDIDALDNTKVPALFYAAMNNFNEGLLAIASKGAKLDQVDGFGNKIAYICFISGNKFAYRFSQNHDKTFDINQTYLNNGTSLCDSLISSKHTNICKYIMKNCHHLLNTNSLINSNKSRSTFKELNYFNYELCRTVYFYKSYGSLFGFIRLMLTLSSYTYKSYMLTFMMYNLIIKNMNIVFKFIIASSIIFSITLKYYINFDSYYNSQLPSFNTEELVSFDNAFLVTQIITLILLVFAYIKYSSIILGKCFSNNEGVDDERKELIYSEDRRSIMKIIKDAIANDPLKLPISNEICEVCLIKKEKSLKINHCSTCNKCIRGYHFHSNILGYCISESTVFSYLLLLISIISMIIGIIFFSYYLTDRKSNGDTCYKSNYFMYNFFIFLNNLSINELAILFTLFLFASYLLQISLALIISFGINSTYYSQWNLHKNTNIPTLTLRNEKKDACSIPKGINIGWVKYIRNIIGFNSNDDE